MIISKIFGRDIREVYREINGKKKNGKNRKEKKNDNRKKKGKKLIDIIMDAIVESKKISIEYVDEKGQKTQRTIRPEKVQDGKVFAYCYLRSDYRMFKIERIKRINLI